MFENYLDANTGERIRGRESGYEVPLQRTYSFFTYKRGFRIVTGTREPATHPSASCRARSAAPDLEAN